MTIPKDNIMSDTTKDAVPLKPCPFCGGTDIQRGRAAIGDRPTFHTYCSSCEAGTQGHPTREASDAAWNRRAPAEVQAESMTGAARDVLAERLRQMSVEGWTPKHDDEHDGGELSRAAACYALEGIAPYTGYGIDIKRTWLDTGWSWSWWKPEGRRRNLVKAGALILAEIERIDRAASGGDQEVES